MTSKDPCLMVLTPSESVGGQEEKCTAVSLLSVELSEKLFWGAGKCTASPMLYFVVQNESRMLKRLLNAMILYNTMECTRHVLVRQERV